MGGGSGLTHFLCDVRRAELAEAVGWRSLQPHGARALVCGRTETRAHAAHVVSASAQRCCVHTY